MRQPRDMATGRFLSGGAPRRAVDYGRIRDIAVASGLVAGLIAGLLSACIPLLVQLMREHWG